MKSKSCESQSTDQMQLQPSQPSVNSSEARGSSSKTGDIGLVVFFVPINLPLALFWLPLAHGEQ